MINVLIPTKPDDEHAIFVQLALKEKGHHAVLWYTADFPVQQTHSFELLNSDICWYSDGTDFEIKNEKFDVVWHRRPRGPVMAESLHPGFLPMMLKLQQFLEIVVKKWKK